MPLSPGRPRRHMHTRQVHCLGYLRDDGLWDIEGHITDTKPYAYREGFRGEMPAGRPVHDMWIRLTLDDAFVVRAVEAVTVSAPYAPCHTVAPDFSKLVGLRVGPGWKRRVRQRLGGIHGCTHMVELLDPMATVAFQTIGSDGAEGQSDPWMKQPEAIEKPHFLNGCRAWASDGPLVGQVFPQFYTGDALKEAGE